MAFIHKKKSSRRPGRLFFIALLVMLTALIVSGYILLFEGEKPLADFANTKAFIGQNSKIHFNVSDLKNGIRSIEIFGSQGDKKKTLHAVTFPRTAYGRKAGPNKESQAITFDPKKYGFKDGPLSLTLEAVDFSMWKWFKGNRTTINKQVTIDTLAPRIQILHSEQYIIPGGTGIAIYRLSDSDVHHGVTVNGHFNPGFLIGDGRDDTYISFFPLPFYTEIINSLFITAEDKAGNIAKSPFSTVYKSDRKKKDKINISDGFLNSKIPEFEQYYPDLSGDSLAKYLQINNAIRKENNQTISVLCNNPLEERLWENKFKRMAGSARAGFADYRTYFHDGKAIDNQVHLGMDIASTRRAEVKAANGGVVIFSDYLGIYGNMVMVDHGQGIFSLYSHLSQFNVSPGEKVDKKTVLGLTGTTGMAGGDHLHFSMLVNGVFVTPKEWWDQHWIDVTIEEPITDSKF